MIILSNVEFSFYKLMFKCMSKLDIINYLNIQQIVSKSKNNNIIFKNRKKKSLKRSCKIGYVSRTTIIAFKHYLVSCLSGTQPFFQCAVSKFFVQKHQDYRKIYSLEGFTQTQKTLRKMTFFFENILGSTINRVNSFRVGDQPNDHFIT